MSIFSLPDISPDPILSIAARVANDGRRDCMDLGIGVYRDKTGETPVFAAVKKAEDVLLRNQTSKAYLGPEGDQAFVAEMSAVAFPFATPFPGIQTVGGSGALRIAAELLAQSANGREVLLGLPSWPNHAPIFEAARLGLRTYRHATATGQFDCDAMLEAIRQCARGDVVLVHASCHNPTGVDPTPPQWREIAAEIERAGAIALVDVAYQGFGSGWNDDVIAVEAICNAVSEVLIAYSCDKNFGLYRDRVGMLLCATADSAASRTLVRHLARHARTSYSMPPDHGAAVVRTILADAALKGEWSDELTGMRERLNSIRQDFARTCVQSGIDVAGLADGRGMFCMLPVSSAFVEELATDHGIYLPPSGRINIASLDGESIDRLVRVLNHMRDKHAA